MILVMCEQIVAAAGRRVMLRCDDGSRRGGHVEVESGRIDRRMDKSLSVRSILFVMPIRIDMDLSKAVFGFGPKQRSNERRHDAMMHQRDRQAKREDH